MRNISVIYILIAGVAISSLSCKKNAGPGKSASGPFQSGAGPISVVAYTVEPMNIVYYDSYPGTVEAINEVQLRSQVAGYVTGIFFNEGSRVAKGQKLYEIDRRKYEAAFDQAKANVKIAEANLDKARRDADRYTALNQQDAIAKQVYEDAITGLENASMQLVATKSALVNTETDYNYSVISSPFSGTIGFSQVKVGAYIVPGQTLLNTISSDDPVGVDFIVDEKLLPGFISLKEKDIRLKTRSDPDSTFRLILPDNTDYGFTGKLSVIDRAVDSQSGTIRLRAVFPNSERTLKPGMNCRIKVLNSSSGNRVVIPYKAVVEQMSEFFVYKIDSNKVKQTRIIRGLNLGEYLEVKEGVKPGEKIVLEGLQKVYNGTTVQITDAELSRKVAGSK